MTSESERGKIGGISSAAILFGACAIVAVLILGWSLFQGTGPAPSSSLELTGQPTQLYVSSNANVRDRPTSQGSQVVSILVPGDIVDGVLKQGEVAGFLWLKLSNGNGYVSIANLAVNPQSAANAENTEAVATATTATASYTDASEFCGAVGTADGPPDARYKGPDRVDWIERAIGFDQGVGYVIWGCDKGAVVACVNYGVTGPCEKVDTNRTAHSGLIDWCKANPNSEIPAAASGHYTAFEWYCKGSSPLIRRQFITPDHRGYVLDDYKEVKRN